VALALLGGLAYALERAGGASTRSVPVWYCGEEEAAARVRYPAGSFYLPFKRAFKGIYPRVRLRAPRFPRFLRRVLDFDGWLYTPAAKSVERSAGRISRTHGGLPQLYLLWIVLGAIIVTGILVWVKG